MEGAGGHLQAFDKWSTIPSKNAVVTGVSLDNHWTVYKKQYEYISAKYTP